MYKIFANDTDLIYDSTLDDLRIGKGVVELEAGKAGSFVFSIYSDHPWFDRFVELKTVVTVYKDDRIVFRGRVLNVSADYWNNQVLTCEGELVFLQDSIVRPYDVTRTPASLLESFINDHNAQVDAFKKFKVGTCTVAPGSVHRSNVDYESTLDNLTSRLLEDSTGGVFLITHGDDGRDPIPTLNYLSNYTARATQFIEFGSNLRDYVRSTSSEEVATAIVPLGAVIDDGNSETEDKRLTIAAVNDGLDYVYSETGQAARGWIFKAVTFDDITDAAALKAKAQEYVETVIDPNITVELTAIDLHLLDRSIESYNVCEWVSVLSAPHRLSTTMLCKRQTLDLLKPENDKVVLGHTGTTFTQSSSRVVRAVSTVAAIPNLYSKLGAVSTVVGATAQNSADIVDIQARLGALEQGGGGGGAGEPGGYYTPGLSQTSETQARMSFAPSKSSMPTVADAVLTLPRGPQGEPGPPGATGATGATGQDGYTPRRGTDYWTPADQAEIKAYVEDAILGGAW